MVGALVGGTLSQALGRKKVALLCMIIYMGGWLLTAFAKTYTMLLCGRLLCGAMFGTRGVSVQLYLAESAHPSIRARLSTSIHATVMLGSLIDYILGSYMAWSTLALVNAAILLPIFGFIALTLPESPLWLISKGKSDEAFRSLAWLHGGGRIDVSEDFREMQKHFLDTQREIATIRDILHFHYLRPVILLLLLVVLRHFTGFNTILYYSYDIFLKSGTGLDPHVGTMILGGVQFLAYIIGGQIMDRMGRRKAVLLSASIMGISELSFATFYYLKELESYHHVTDAVPWFPLVALNLVMIGFSLGVGSIIVIFNGELIPVQIKSKTTGVVNFVVTAFAFVILEVFFYMVDAIGLSGTFWIFGGVCFLLAIYFQLVMPETKGQKTEEIERRLTRSKSQLQGIVGSTMPEPKNS